ncbi:sulfatase-like hydrolase/transferase [Fulvivirgaceae bacterium BMA10]|uniref:Sulfatase-like hydrolase/transferase n=1 Tax=Splendidivirga corallicola TaxID=3051826 RepID=A0ABT8KN20_9BACT|nr:sulfatase-like hydrolase/transferase [Fulvivirgaceae bacterium BMA10]
MKAINRKKTANTLILKLNIESLKVVLLVIVNVIAAFPSIVWAHNANEFIDSVSVSDKPNIIIILTDDAGYSDFGFQGNKDFDTPNIDALAKSGVICTQGYVSESVCSPSRAGLLTGRYQQRFGHEYNLPGKPEKGDMAEYMGLPIEERTLAAQLKSLGYQTGAIGKWHLGHADHFHPNKRGFDEFFGMLGGSNAYFDSLRSDRKGTRILRNSEPVQNPLPYLTEAFGKEACDFIKRHKDNPFFLYLAFNAVHTPMHAKSDDLRLYDDINGKARRTLAAMTKSLDDQIGAIMAQLKTLKLDKKTIVFFLNDNGGAHNNGSRNVDLKGGKGTLMEGGIRVPFLISWKGKLASNKYYHFPVSALDIYATTVGIAGGALSKDRKYDGVNLIPFLTGIEKQRPHEILYWRRSKGAAIRKGDWKLIRLPDRPPMLFDLSKDANESFDLNQNNPEKVKELMMDLFAWETELAHPLWVTSPIWIKRNIEHYNK